jgi:small GTP-binding protein
VGVDFNLQVVNIDGVNASVQLWDIAGQDRYISMARAYYQSSQGAIIVYDVTNTASFEHVTKWKREIDEKVQLPSGEPLPVVLVGNKCDLEPGFALPNMDAYTRKHGFIAHLQTSAKSNINVNECMETLIKNIMARGEVVSKQQALNEERDTISAQLSADAASNGKGCC